MTNPRCPTCRGTGYTNQVTGSDRHFTPKFDPPVMVLCDDVYPSGPRQGSPCTPRTQFRKVYGAPGKHQADDTIRGGLRLPSEKAFETRQANAARKAANK